MAHSYEDRWRELARLRQEAGSTSWPWQKPKPTALVAAARHAGAARLILTGLERHYFECLASGRMDVWKGAAIAAVNLLADVPDVPFQRRA